MPELTGRELDAAVARAIGKRVKILHLSGIGLTPCFCVGDTWAPIRYYSTDANMLIDALEVMRQRGWVATILCYSDGNYCVLLIKASSVLYAISKDGRSLAEAGSRAIVAAAVLEVAGAE